MSHLTRFGLAALALMLAVGVGVGGAAGPLPRELKGGAGPQLSGAVEEGRDVNFGTRITECPQAGNTNPAKPLDRRAIDAVEQVSRRGDDRRSNADYSCFPQDEVSVDVNPKNSRNFVIGANDYRLGTGSSGFYWTTNSGRSFYDGIIPFPSGPAGQTRGEGFVPSGGDPVIVYDRDGVVYYAQIGFFRGDDTNGVFVQRSTNGGATWSRACIPVSATACGGPGDARQPGDGVVSFFPDPDGILNGSVPFEDKEYMTTGPRPDGVSPACFAPITRAQVACDPDVVGVDRIYVTWTRFDATGSRIHLSYSDDQARSWSPATVINGSAPFCVFGSPAGACSDDQASYPTVSPATGSLYVQFENFNTPDENQILVVRSSDGGSTFQGPFFVTPVFDLNFPRVGITRPDCSPRGAQFARIVYTNSCFRSNAYGTIAVDERGGAFADDLYLVTSDNRNGTIGSSNADVFLFKSTNGGSSWIGPTRVNTDQSSLGGVSRDCGRPPGTVGGLPIPAGCVGTFGNDQWWPWVDIGTGGELNIAFKDRRLDTDSTASEWPTSRQRAGNYLVWTWGAQCRVSQPNSRECLAPAAAVIPQPTGPVDPGADPVPGQGNQYVGSLENHQVSDVPSNYDYSFRAGLFAGDYENIVVADRERGRGDDDDDAGEGRFVINVFTDARNGRSSRNQPGRNPICEQSDVFFDIYRPLGARSDSRTTDYAPFLVTPCAPQAVDPRQNGGNDD